MPARCKKIAEEVWW